MSELRSSIPILCGELKRRLRTPIGQVSFWTYFIVAIAGFGALGVWVEVVRASPAPDGLLTAIYTYFPAIAAGSALQMQMDAKKEHQQYLRSFCVLSGFFIFLFMIPFMNGSKSFIWGGVGIVASLLLWWVANGVNPSFLDIDPKDSLGASPDAELSGDTGGFNL